MRQTDFESIGRGWWMVKAVAGAVLVVALTALAVLATVGGRFSDVTANYVPGPEYGPGRLLEVEDIEFVANRGVFGGYLDGTFRPYQKITPEQLAVVIGRAFPDGLTRAEAASFLRGGESRVLDYQDGWGLKIEAEHKGSFGRDQWGGWRQPEVDVALSWGRFDCKWAFYASSLVPACNVSNTDPQRDHLVAVKEVFDSGGWDETVWDEEQRRTFFNDTENLFVLSQKDKASKGDKDPAGWLPVRNSCEYVRKWIDIKRKWQLSADLAELSAITGVLSSGECDETSSAVLTARYGGNSNPFNASN